MSTFGHETIDLMRIALAHRGDGPAERRAMATELLAYFERTPGGPWSAPERDGIEARLRKALAAPPAADAGAPAVAPAVVIDVPPLRDEDRVTWIRIVEERQAGAVREAWEKLRPLASAYPDVLAVQDLRCQIAMQLSFDWTRTRAECEPMMQLTMGKADAGR